MDNKRRRGDEKGLECNQPLYPFVPLWPTVYIRANGHSHRLPPRPHPMVVFSLPYPNGFYIL